MPKYSDYQAVFTSPFANLGLKLDQKSISGLDFIFDDISQPMFKSELAESIAEQFGFYFENPHFQATD